jgi:sucrose-6-phosphate hydrolase SacC (GH32 family)
LRGHFSRARWDWTAFHACLSTAREFTLAATDRGRHPCSNIQTKRRESKKLSTASVRKLETNVGNKKWAENNIPLAVNWFTKQNLPIFLGFCPSCNNL